MLRIDAHDCLHDFHRVLAAYTPDKSLYAECLAAEDARYP